MNRLIQFCYCLLIAVVMTPSGAAEAGVCTLGHAHAGVTFNGTQLTLGLYCQGATVDGVVYNAPLPGYYFNPADVVILVPATTWQKAEAVVADDAPYLGLPAGSDYFRLSELSQDCSKEKTSYFGFGTEAIKYDTFVGNTVNFALTAVVAAPAGGQFSVYEAGPKRWMDTTDGSFANDVLPLPAYTHGHYSFGFSKPGVYQLRFTASAQLPAGGTVSDTRVFTFDVPGSATWTRLGLGGTWGDVANWRGSAGGTAAWDSWVPNSAYDWATLAKATTAATEVTLDGALTLGRLTLGKDAAGPASAGYKLLSSSEGGLTLDRGRFTTQQTAKSTMIEVPSGQHEIAVAVKLADNTEVSVADGSGLLISNGITQTTDGLAAKKLTKTGGGTLTLSGSAGYTGGTWVQAGTLTITSADALPLGRNVTIQAGGRLVLASGLSGAAVSAAVSDSLTAPAVVPEPGTLALLAAGFAVLVVAGGRPGRTP